MQRALAHWPGPAGHHPGDPAALIVPCPRRREGAWEDLAQAYLIHHYGEAYEITCGAAGTRARRRHDTTVLTADSADALGVQVVFPALAGRADHDAERLSVNWVPLTPPLNSMR